MSIMFRNARRFALLIASTGILSAATAAVADKQNAFSAEIVDMPVATLLTVIGDEFGMEFSGEISPRHRVSRLSLNGSPDDVWKTVIDAAQLDAFEFNGQTYVSPAEERAVRLVVLGDIDPKIALEALASADLLFSDFEVAEVANGGALVMSGPVQYLALSEAVIDAITLVPEETPPAVRVRRGVEAVSEAKAVADVVNSN